MYARLCTKLHTRTPTELNFNCTHVCAIFFSLCKLFSLFALQNHQKKRFTLFYFLSFIINRALAGVYMMGLIDNE